MLGLVATLAGAACAQEKSAPPVQLVMACAHGTHDEVTSDGAMLCRSIDLAGMEMPSAPRPVSPSARPVQPLPPPVPARPRAMRPQTAPVLLYSVDPVYPWHAAIKGVEGDSLLTIVVGTDGKPANIRVVRSISPELDKAAVAAVSQYQFQPATVDGQPIQAQIPVEVHFHVASR